MQRFTMCCSLKCQITCVYICMYVCLYVFRTLMHEWFCKKWPGFQSDFQLLSSAVNLVAILDLDF